jgi:ribosome maturation factor RimP
MFTEPKAWASWVHAFFDERPKDASTRHGPDRREEAHMSDSRTLSHVTRLVAPIVADLGLDLYDVELRGGTLRITLDTPAGSAKGVDLEQLSLATRLIGRDLDHEDPVAGRYTLEVTSPGVERSLRTPAHFRREVGKVVALRLRDTAGADRRVQGELIAADDDGCTVRLAPARPSEAPVERTVAYAQIDRAHTVFEWGPQPKPGKQPRRPRSTSPADQQPATQQEARAS